MSEKQPPSGFKDLLSNMMARRWYITALVLGGFMLIIGGMFVAIINKNEIAGEWKELLLLLLGAFIGSYGKIIDYWFSDTDKDKMLVQKMDEEDGTSLSDTVALIKFLLFFVFFIYFSDILTNVVVQLFVFLCLLLS